MKPLTREQAAAILLAQNGIDPTKKEINIFLAYIDQLTAEKKAKRPK